MDDIFIFTKELQQNIEYTKWTLQQLQENNLYLKPEKCTFWTMKVEYLGLIIQENLISMDPVKLNGIKDWPTLTTVKQIRSFLGFGNYYQQFIHRYGNLTQPLNDLLRMDERFEWTPEWQDAFHTLKQRFTESPVLLMPNSLKPFVLETDASLFASRAVLRQQDSNGDWHPCAYLFKSFNDTEHNYNIWDGELLAVIRALTERWHYLQGSPHTVTLLSNHQNLAYFRKPQRLNRRQARWSLLFNEYDLKLVHVPKTKMIQSDALSQRPDLCPENNQDNVNKTLLSDGLFISAFALGEEELADDTEQTLLLDHIFLNTFDLDLHTWIIASTNQDRVVSDALTTLQTNGTPPMKSALSDWRHEDGIVFYKDRCYMPNDIGLRQEIVKRYHDLPPMGHPGHLKALELLQHDYWWPGMHTFMKNFVDGCAACQQAKINQHPTNPPLMPIKGSTTGWPFAQISYNFITDLLVSDGFDSLMVMVDHGLSKGVILCPCHKTIDATRTVELLIQNIHRRFGLLDRGISDKGPQFASKVFKEMGHLLGIELAMSTTYHPQTDGATKRSNCEIEAYLAIFCANNPKQWSRLILIMKFSYNQKSHTTQMKSPFYLIMGSNPKAIPTAFPSTNIPEAEEWIRNLQKAQDEAIATHELARQKMIEQTTHKFKLFQKNNLVWLESKNLKLRYESKKVAPKWEGPFRISEVLGPLTYRLELPEQWKIHPMFHATLLTPFKENDIHGPNYLNPPPDLIDGEPEYEVEAIEDKEEVIFTSASRKITRQPKILGNPNNTFHMPETSSKVIKTDTTFTEKPHPFNQLTSTCLTSLN